ncbi:hypothetical protein CXF67_03470 [Psychroflexus sp. MES1-P1E]|nr:hypothetical protein CXF67_03470 [Psychroflexus sp. MES1-P1E]
MAIVFYSERFLFISFKFSNFGFTLVSKSPSIRKNPYSAGILHVQKRKITTNTTFSYSIRKVGNSISDLVNSFS